MNLGGRRVTNEELCRAAAACGYVDVVAYQASGNLVIHSDQTERQVTQTLEDGLEAELGYPVPTFLRSAAELERLAGASPFDAEQLAASTGKPQVILLRSPLGEDVVADVQGLAPPGDVIVAGDRELHWLPAGGLSDSTLDLRRLDAALGGTTIRTHGTLQRMARKFL